MKVFDFSRHNIVTDWDAIKANCDAVILRCGYRGYGVTGRLCEDTKFRKYREECKKRDIPYGVYFFPTSITDAEARSEAVFVHELVGDDDLAFPVFADSEFSEPKNKSGRNDKLSKSDRTHLLLVFLEELSALGLKCGVYASTSWFKDHLNDYELSAYPHWVAQYAKQCTYTGAVFGWQYTSKYELPGAVEKPFDCSEFYNGEKSSHVVIAKPTLRKGNKGSEVAALQKNLQMCGFTLDADGKFGPITETYLSRWQASKELVADGIYGPKSYAKMKETLMASE